MEPMAKIRGNVKVKSKKEPKRHADGDQSLKWISKKICQKREPSNRSGSTSLRKRHHGGQRELYTAAPIPTHSLNKNSTKERNLRTYCSYNGENGI
uniref:Uncharacterized protein n=1 Tax=Arundo donax TaxID=35708 RepID=A0A0A9EIE1_ARUDO